MSASVRVLRLGRPTLQNDASTGVSVPTDVVILPHTAPHAHMGETSFFLVAVSGVSSATSLRLEVRCPSGKVTEILSADAEPEVPLTIGFEPEETGPHTLAAALAVPEPVKRTWRFEVTEAVNIRTRIAKTATGVAIEVQVENASESAVTIESVNLVASPGWQSSPATDTMLIKPKDIAQYLLLAVGTGNSLGKVFVRWRHEPLGGPGKSATPELWL